MPLTLDGNGDIAGLVAGALPSNVIGAGGILQVVNATYSTQVSSTSTSYVDTGLSLSITPTSASNKILILINQYVYIYDTSSEIAVSVGLQIVRNSTAIFTPASKEQFYAFIPNGPTRVDLATLLPLQYLDSPATTSAVTYKTQGALFNSAGNQTVLYQGSSISSTITLMEIAG